MRNVFRIGALLAILTVAVVTVVIAKRTQAASPTISPYIGVNRAGTEYACYGGNSIFDGPTDIVSIQAILTWHVRTVRLPLNEDCWLDTNEVPAATSGNNYRQPLHEYVSRLRQAGLTVVLDLHWISSGGRDASHPMADAALSPQFWTQVATEYKSDPGIIFDLYNEPHDLSWQCWRDGGSTCQNPLYPYAGMQQLLNAVRSTGATNLVIAGGLGWANDLSQWLAYRPQDNANNLGASWHLYNFNGCSNETCWNNTIAPIAAQGIPIIIGELGENDCASDFTKQAMNWADAHGVGYLPWAWNPTMDCGGGPSLIQNYTGTPTNFGIGVRDHLLALPANGVPVSTPTVTPTNSIPQTPMPVGSIPSYANGFDSLARMQINGNSVSLNGTRLRLTPNLGGQRGSAFFLAPVNIQQFTTQFTFKNTNAAADGFTFTLQNSGLTALGAGGGSIGYQGITKSVAVTFDLYDNVQGKPATLVGLFTNGDSIVDSQETSFAPLDFRSGDRFQVTISAASNSLTVNVVDMQTGTGKTLTKSLNIAQIVGNPTAFMGFTAATGSQSAIQEIDSWVVNSSPISTTPIPTTPTPLPTATPPTSTMTPVPSPQPTATPISGDSSLIDYGNGFSNTSHLQMNGTGIGKNGTALFLTHNKQGERTSVYASSQVPVKGFTTSFTFQMSQSKADGFAFVIQNAGPTALGPGGGNLGYTDIPRSIALSFDLYDNDTGKGTSSVGVFSRGTYPNKPETSIAPMSFQSGHTFLVDLTYNGTILTETITDLTTKGQQTQTVTIDIPSIIGGSTAYMGFTASTGYETSTISLLSWTYKAS
jgi:hypothetical protein